MRSKSQCLWPGFLKHNISADKHMQKKPMIRMIPIVISMTWKVSSLIVLNFFTAATLDSVKRHYSTSLTSFLSEVSTFVPSDNNQVTLALSYGTYISFVLQSGDQLEYKHSIRMFSFMVLPDASYLQFILKVASMHLALSG